MLREILDWISNNNGAAFVAAVFLFALIALGCRFVAVLVRGWPKKGDKTLLDD